MRSARARRLLRSHALSFLSSIVLVPVRPADDPPPDPSPAPFRSGRRAIRASSRAWKSGRRPPVPEARIARAPGSKRRRGTDRVEDRRPGGPARARSMTGTTARRNEAGAARGRFASGLPRSSRPDRVLGPDPGGLLARINIGGATAGGHHRSGREPRRRPTGTRLFLEKMPDDGAGVCPRGIEQLLTGVRLRSRGWRRRAARSLDRSIPPGASLSARFFLPGVPTLRRLHVAPVPVPIARGFFIKSLGHFLRAQNGDSLPQPAGAALPLRGCGRCFSRQTFRADCRQKKPFINARWPEPLVSCVGLRQRRGPEGRPAHRGARFACWPGRRPCSSQPPRPGRNSRVPSSSTAGVVRVEPLHR